MAKREPALSLEKQDTQLLVFQEKIQNQLKIYEAFPSFS